MIASEKTYGQLELVEMGGTLHKPIQKWKVSGSGVMLSRLKRIFAKPAAAGAVLLDTTPNNALDLLWLMERYPLRMLPETEQHLNDDRDLFLGRRAKLEDLRVNGAAKKNTIQTLLTLRKYQETAVAILQERLRLLVGDDLGLGKTAVALGGHASGLGPTIIVCQTHLQQQWKREAEKFLFGVEVHIVKKTKVYELPAHDFLVIPYSKLSGWGDWLAEAGYGFLVFDEVQELRRPDSLKYRSAAALSGNVPYCLGLTATPIYNYGEEIFHVSNVIEEGVLGSFQEFTREWCTGCFNHWAVTHPSLMNEHLVEELGFFLRRRRHEVGRELPPVLKIIETVECNPKALEEVQDQLAKLALQVLNATQFEEKGKAARELDLKLRQATGIAKAVDVARYVMERVDAGEKVVLGGWHRAVYDVWRAMFEEGDRSSGDHRRYRSVLYTGSESSNQKQAAVDTFINGEAEILILSLRSGAGLNGLQEVASLVVFGELDWSPQVHDQFIGRLNRDGQSGNVTAVYLVSEEGSDPTVASVLGIKREQSQGIVDGENESDLDTPTKSRGIALAERIVADGGDEILKKESLTLK